MMPVQRSAPLMYPTLIYSLGEMTEKPDTTTPRPGHHINPKSDEGMSRSAQALRANLLKRKAQQRARITPDPTSDPTPDSGAPNTDDAK